MLSAFFFSFIENIERFIDLACFIYSMILYYIHRNMTELFFKSVMERKKGFFVSTFLSGRDLGQLNVYECDRK